MINNKTIKKLVIIFALFFIVFFIYSSTVSFAFNVNDYKYGTKYQKTFQDEGEKIFGIIRVVGTVISVAAIVIIGIRYMLASVEEKAEYKITIPYYIIGAALLFAASNLVQYLYDAIMGL